MNKNIETSKKGFTLLELLIVITIISVLSVILIVALNPAETLRKARDTQRLSDLASLKTAIGIYVTSKTSPFLGSDTANTLCQDTPGSYASGDKIWYSYPSDSPGAAITDTTLDATNATGAQVTNANLGKVDGSGWVPVDLDDITGGSPISNMPIDPVNTIADEDNVAMTDLVYRYTCEDDNLTFEINAKLESTAFTVDDNRATKDGGNNTTLYEVGTSLLLLGDGSSMEF